MSIRKEKPPSFHVTNPVRGDIVSGSPRIEWKGSSDMCIFSQKLPVNLFYARKNYAFK